MRAQDAGGKRLEIVFGAAAQPDLTDVVADVEGGIELPMGQAEIQRRENYALAIAGNEWQPRLDQFATGLQGQLAFEDADPRDAQRLARTFNVEKEGVCPGEGILQLWAGHVVTPFAQEERR